MTSADSALRGGTFKSRHSKQTLVREVARICGQGGRGSKNLKILRTSYMEAPILMYQVVQNFCSVYRPAETLRRNVLFSGQWNILRAMGGIHFSCLLWCLTHVCSMGDADATI